MTPKVDAPRGSVGNFVGNPYVDPDVPRSSTSHVDPVPVSVVAHVVWPRGSIGAQMRRKLRDERRQGDSEEKGDVEDTQEAGLKRAKLTQEEQEKVPVQEVPERGFAHSHGKVCKLWREDCRS